MIRGIKKYIELNTSKDCATTNLEEDHGGAILYNPVFYLCLLGQVISRIDRRFHPLHGEEGSQVCRVGGDDDECKKPPDSSYNSGGEGFRHELRS